MRIRSYLAILVVILLVGGNGVQYFLNEKFFAISEQSQEHVEALLWQKDFQRISADINQYLISTDLVIGSSETYLADGALRKGRLIASGLKTLASSNQLLADDRVSDMHDVAEVVHKINGFIEQVAMGEVQDGSQALNALLKEYDQIAADVGIYINRVGSQLRQAVQQNTDR